MPFGMVDMLGPRMRQVDGGRDRHTGRSNSEVDVGHSIVANEDFVA